MNIRAVAFATIFLTSTILFGTQTFADVAGVFTKLEGKFRGNGTGVSGRKDKKVRITCQLTNSYNKTSGKLAMKGKCASSRGSRKVNGAISHTGEKITGTYLSLRPDIKLVKSSGKANANSLVISSSYSDETLGRLYSFRQNIKLTATGFIADFYTFDKKTKKYKSAGSINFKRK